MRIRTLRLELGPAGRDELGELGELAERGVHPPDEMPFNVPWTDEIAKPSFVDGFVAYHREQLAAWRPDDWHLHLLVWFEGELAGTQGIRAMDFAVRREVATGCWLGKTFQGRGIGTEMRAAVVELAFAGLGAETAVSAWLDGNNASRRVSEKLGYVSAGEKTASPRGVAVTSHIVRLARGDWSPPVEVEIVGLEPALRLFGAG